MEIRSIFFALAEVSGCHDAAELRRSVAPAHGSWTIAELPGPRRALGHQADPRVVFQWAKSRLVEMFVQFHYSNFTIFTIYRWLSNTPELSITYK